MTFRLISLYERRESRLNISARRFCKRAREHGLLITEPLSFYPTHVIVRFGRRAIRIDQDGACVPVAGFNDPFWRSNHSRLHAHNLDLAGRFRRRDRKGMVRAALDNCRRERASCPPLPA